jgi:hypothetical protein
MTMVEVAMLGKLSYTPMAVAVAEAYYQCDHDPSLRAAILFWPRGELFKRDRR